MRKRGRGDPEVVCPRRPAAPTKVGPDFSVDARDLFGDRQRLEAGKNVLDERPPAIPRRARRAVNPVQ